MPSPFTAKTLSFLRALKRHNDRDWFRGRKHQYEEHVRGPMIALLEQLAPDLRSFAPELVCDPKVSLYRIYRDTRFSEDKSPLKTHVAAHFPMRGMPRGSGAVLRDCSAVGVDWRRHLHAEPGQPARHPRAHRRDPPAAAPHRLAAGVFPDDGRGHRRAADASARRVPEGPSGCRIPPLQAVSRRTRT